MKPKISFCSLAQGNKGSRGEHREVALSKVWGNALAERQGNQVRSGAPWLQPGVWQQLFTNHLWLNSNSFYPCNWGMLQQGLPFWITKGWSTMAEEMGNHRKGKWGVRVKRNTQKTNFHDTSIQAFEGEQQCLLDKAAAAQSVGRRNTKSPGLSKQTVHAAPHQATQCVATPAKLTLKPGQSTESG